MKMLGYLLKYYIEAKLFILLPERWANKFQLRKFRRMVKVASNGSVFYRELYKNAGVLNMQIKSFADIQKLPIVNKQLMLAAKKTQLLTTPVTDNMAVNSSSGSTGQPMSIYSTKREHFTSYVRTFLALKGYNPLKKFVFIGMSEQKERNEKQSFLYLLQKYTGLFKREKYSVHTPPGEIVKKLHGRRIDYISSTVTCVQLLLDELKETGNKLQVKYVVVSGETVFDDFRQEVNKYLNAALINVYGCTELLSMAWSQANAKGFNYLKNTAYLEYTNPVEINGEMYGELVITNLLNKTQPFIRYNIRDLVKIPLAAGNMGEIIGRIEDNIDLGNGKKLHRLQLCSMYKPLTECSQFKLIKKKDNKIYFQTKLKPGEEKASTQQKIQAIWNEYIADCLLEVEFLDQIPLSTATGKFKIIEVE
ncbi:hypothetical protein [uncultured Draconibacterium sp.]|uniref:hypothetical protein n=1 Tax=uncultured Draconibacterium sp. TaxID=1573823 RepID=UPI00326075F3